MSKYNYRIMLAGLYAVATVGYHAVATADQTTADAATTGNGELQEIVVTAQRRAENLQQVPITVNVVTAQQLESTGVRTTYDLPQLIPGLVIFPGAGAVQINLRGIGLSSFGGNNESTTAFYVDDVYYSSPVGAIARLENVDSVEVLKGPQGTLYGRNATAGLINVHTPDPQAEGFVKTAIGYESYSTYNGSLYATGGLTDRLQGNLAGSVHYQREGFGRDLTLGTDVNFVRNGELRGKLLWEPTSADSVRFAASYFLDRGDFGFVDTLMPGVIGLNGQTFPGNIYDIYWEKPFYHKGESYDGSLRWQHTFLNGMAFKSLTAYRRTDMRNENYDLDVTAAPLGEANFEIQDYTWQQELLLQGAWERLNLTAGYFYFRDRNYYPIFVQQSVNEFTYSGTNSNSIFGQMDYRLTDRDTLTLGLRYTIDRVFASGQFVLGGATLQSIGSQQRQYGEPTWRVALKHEFTNELMVYGSVNRGYKSGLYDPGNPFVPPVKPEILNAYEAGLKGDLFDKHLQLGLSGFYYNYSNMQVGQLHDTLVDFTNAGRAKIYGLEVNILGAIPLPLGNLQVRSDFGLLHAKFSAFPNCTIVIANVPRPGVTQTTGDCSGNDLIDAPRFQLTITPEYTVPVGSGKLGVSMTAYHNDGYFFTVDNFLKQSPYTLIGADVAYTFSNDRSRVRVYGNNLTNVQARGFAESGTVESDSRPQPPRIVGVELQHTW